jgi:hypothetical protein
MMNAELVSRHIAVLLAATLALGLTAQLPDATRAEAAGQAADLRVGHTVKHIVVKGSAAGEDRQVDVHLWYPADQKGLSDRPKTVYRSALYGKTLISGRWDPLSWQVEAEVARENAPIDRNGPAFPVIVFSHGSTNDPIDYAHTLELIAGAGFVVAAPTHVNNTQDDERIDFINAEAAKVQPGLHLFDCRDGRPSPCSRANVARSMEDRVRDISRTLDELPEWFGDRADVSRVGVMGHSRGTVSALAAAGGSTTWGFGPVPGVDAVMGLAIGARGSHVRGRSRQSPCADPLARRPTRSELRVSGQRRRIRRDRLHGKGVRVDHKRGAPQLRLDLLRPAQVGRSDHPRGRHERPGRAEGASRLAHRQAHRDVVPGRPVGQGT